MSQLRCLALDFDAPALAEVTYLLATDDRVVSVRSAANLSEASKIVKSESIDAVFVCLVHHTPMEVQALIAMSPNQPNFVVLARDADHALDAFDFGAVDYIVKPVTRLSMHRALDRLTTLTNNHFTGTRLHVERDGINYFVDCRDVFWIEADGDYTRVSTQTGVYTSRQSLTTLEETLSHHHFLRVHRSWLVPVRRIESLSHISGKYVVSIGDHHIPVSRRALATLKEQLG
jgi:two-component system response regulator LytT